jgi:hypothetical protein
VVLYHWQADLSRKVSKIQAMGDRSILSIRSELSEADDVAVPADLALRSLALFVHSGIALALFGLPYLSDRLVV